jgi:ATP-dependent DNA ligase
MNQYLRSRAAFGCSHARDNDQLEIRPSDGIPSCRQTQRFPELETRREGHVVYVRPEQVVEIAFDGVQASSRYPGGMALRFARVKGYREDKSAEEADTIDAVRAVFEG